MADEAPQSSGTPTFAELLKRHRIEAALSQEALAARAGLSVRAISDLERGVKKRPYLETVRLLADALDLTLPARAELARAGRIQMTVMSSVLNEPAPDTGADALPLPPTPLVGREREIAAIEAALRERETRLVTLAGTGGVGKTRLALATARRMTVQFSSGIVWVDFAPLDDPNLVLPTIALSLGARDADHQSLARSVRERVDGRQLLVIFDNCEHLLDAISESAALLTAVPGPTLMATSRIPLDIDAERLFRVEPLDLPDPDRPILLGEVRENDAVSLFVARAKTVRSDFELDENNVGSVVRICRHLDGLPLAIELAAARMRVLTPAALGALIGTHLEVLGEGPADAPARQRRIESTIAWSYALLSSQHQRVFRRLGVFAGGCSLNAVTTVTSDTDAPALHDQISVLVNENLVRQVDGPAGETRFLLLETVRQFAERALDQSAEAGTIRERHARYFCALAQAAEPGMRGSEQKAWLDRLTADLPNLRGAMTWGIDHGDGELVLGIAVSLWRYWLARGELREGSVWLERGLAAGHLSISIRCQGLASAASLARLRGDFATAERLGNELLSIARATDDEWGIVTGLSILGLIISCQGRLDEAAQLGEEALTHARDFGDTHILALAHYRLADAYDERDWIRAREHYREALRLWQSIDHGWGICGALLQLGVSEHRLGNPAKAVACYRDELLLALEIDDRSLVAAGLVCLGEAVSLTNQLEPAARLLGTSSALNSAFGGVRNRVAEKQYQSTLARIKEGLGPDAFHAYWQDALSKPIREIVHEALTIADSLQPQA